MLIHALCDYYDILAKSGKVLPDGYSKVKVHYLIALTEEGKIDDIINYQDKEIIKGKVKWIPKEEMMPLRTEKPGIEANIIEHRPLYLFGLNLQGEELTPEDRTGKAEKSHEACIINNLKFLEGLDSPIINAYRNFLKHWNAKEETQNSFLIGLGKDYGKSGFAFCVSGNPECLLHKDKQILDKWEQQYHQKKNHTEETYISQCSVSGANAPIARIHSKIKGIYGGLATGSVLIGFNNPSEESYGNEQSYNSNISTEAMKKYTESLNYLLSNGTHKIMLDDLTIIFWAMNPTEDCESKFMAMLMGSAEGMDSVQTNNMLKSLMEDVRIGKVTEERLLLSNIQSDVDFYIIGLKPNSSRVSVKFIYRRKYADILWNIVKHQADMQISEEIQPVPFWRIKAELVSPKSKNDKINPALAAKMFEAVIYGKKYPDYLLQTIVRRIRTDTDIKINPVRAGIVKACINRNYSKEELKVALDKENYGQAYLCGRLFAVLEKLQLDASNQTLNRTIKDSYFASASSKPAIIFPKLMKLAQNHLGKVKYPIYYNKLIGEIIDKLNGEFPETLLLSDQGKFIIGYYHQYQSFFKKSDKDTLETNNHKEEI